MKKKKLYINTFSALIYQLCSVVIGLILPRLILQSFGSEINGITNSISQMLSIISLLDLGVGAVVQAALYKPLVDNDNYRIDEIYSSAKKFFNLIAEILVIYVVILCGYYSIFRSENFGRVFTISLILAIALSYFAQYYFGICNILLLNADQKVYIVTIVNLISLIINALMTVILLKLHASIQIVKLASSIVYFFRPVVLELYVRKKYKINIIENPSKDAISNKWNGLAQHVAVVITNTVDNFVLTVFSTFSLVSVYNVYVMPLNSIKALIESTSTSYKSFFGQLIAQGEEKKLLKEFRQYEVVMHYVVTVVFGSLMKVLVPFVMLYTKGVSDVNYKDIIFAALITTAYASFTIRVIYTNLIFAAGKFKETQKYCIMECIINIFVSIGLVKAMGLSGVAIGTVISSVYRMIASVVYIKKDILQYRFSAFWKILMCDMFCVIIFLTVTKKIVIPQTTFIEWFIFSSIAFFINVGITAFIFSLIYKEYFNIFDLIQLIKSKIRRR